jgi:molybdenum cofactor cytidylyltransferase
MSLDPTGVLIPAAGRSTRMGSPKPLLRLGGSDFIGTLLATVVAVRPALGPVVVITHRDDPALAGRLAELSRSTIPLVVATVDAWAGDMLDSIRAGASRLPAGAGALIWPVDAPAVRVETVERLLAAAAAHAGAACLPLHEGRSGHPVYLPPGLLERLGQARPADGLRGILAAADPRPIEIAVDDPGVGWNVNTPEAYARLCGAAGPA